MSTTTSQQRDILLIQQAISGDSSSLEKLIKKYQDWIFNVAVNFTGDRDEAADLSQEVLIKMITKLSSFRQDSQFTTWLFRITKNHFLNSKRRQTELNSLSFEAFGQGLDLAPDIPLSNHIEPEGKLLVKEAKLSCMKGMLLCLEPAQRMIYILGELFEFPDTIGGEIMEISKANFRVKLHRSRQQLYNFMNEKCGLVNKNNPCRCANKTAAFIEKGFVDPVNLHFQKDTLKRIDEVLEEKIEDFQKDIHEDYQKLFQEHPFLENPKTEIIKDWLNSDKMKEVFDLK
ncbi:MAG: RNA polymerase sigma factor [Roseivirga sp.]|nr:RNA polymerase sigma factor [Roseivirga sp.]